MFYWLYSQEVAMNFIFCVYCSYIILFFYFLKKSDLPAPAKKKSFTPNFFKPCVVPAFITPLAKSKVILLTTVNIICDHQENQLHLRSEREAALTSSSFFCDDDDDDSSSFDFEYNDDDER